MSAKCLAAILLVLSGASALAQNTGPATVVDGETLVVGGKTYRLYGIDAPDLRQRCEIRGRTYNCGNVSRTALMDLVAGSSVTCVPIGEEAKDSNAARTAVCRSGGYDLSEGMVHTGWALAMPREGTKYARIERRAEKSKHGLWKGRFVRPWAWTP